MATVHAALFAFFRLAISTRFFLYRDFFLCFSFLGFFLFTKFRNERTPEGT